MYEAMEWLGSPYNAGRTFAVKINNGRWQYVYKNRSSSLTTEIMKNGEYLG